jgi:general secretion pathway protein D
MTKPIQALPNVLRRGFLIITLLGTLPLFAQEAEETPATGTPTFGQPGSAPGFTPPPPPNFSPPPLPPELLERMNAARGTNAPQPGSPAGTVQFTEADLSERTSDLVDADNPVMQEVVGLIRIPEMGTNEVIEMLETFTEKPVLRQQTLPSVKITFFSQSEMTRGEAITAVESLLALNGIAITELGDRFLKAVPASIINAQVPRVWEGTTLTAVPSQVIYEKMFETDFLGAQEAAAILQPLVSQGAPVAFAKSNLLLITDALVNLQRIERLLPSIDRPARLSQDMLFFELKNIESREVVERLERLATGPLKNRFEGNTAFEADERTNQIIVFTHPSNSELITELIERLDIDVAPQTATKVYSIRYADATELVGIIEQIVTGQRQVRNETTGSTTNNNTAAARRAANQAAQVRRNNQAVAAARAEASNLQFSDFLTIVPDERANTIVASGTRSDLSYLEQLIEEIDTLLAQVRIEVVITDVSLNKDQTRGIDNFGFNFTITNPDTDFSDAQEYWTLSPGDFYGVKFSDIRWGESGSSIGFVLDTAKTNRNVSVLSAPTIVTTHNKEATVSVGEERPVITSVIRDTTAATTTQEQVQYRDINLELKVTPLIGSDGVVQLEIDQQVQSVIDTVSVNDNPQPVVGTRSATSYVSVRDGEMIALGGLQSVDKLKSSGSMAILGGIPLLGELFKSKSTEDVRRELLIFIRPTIIRTTTDANRDANKLIDKVQDSEEIRNYLDTGTIQFEETEEPTEQRKVPRRNQP